VSLRQILCLTFSLMVGLVIAVVLVFVDSRLSERAVETRLRDLGQLSASLSQMMRVDLAARERRLDGIAATFDEIGVDRTGAVPRLNLGLLERMLRQSDEAGPTRSGYVSSDGILALPVGSDGIGGELGEEAWMPVARLARQTGDGMASAFLPSAHSLGYLVSFRALEAGPDGTSIGWLVAEMPLSDLVAQVERTVEISGSPEMRVAVSGAATDRRPDAEALTVAATVPLDIGALRVTLSEPLAVTLAPLRDFREILVLIGLGGFLASVLIGYLIAEAIGNPLDRLARAAERDDLDTYRSPRLIREVRQLHEVLSRTWRQARLAQADLNEANRTLESRVHERTRELVAAQVTLQKTLDARTNYLRFLSHEIRTPLTGLIGHVEMLMQERTSPAGQRHLAAAEEAGQQMKRILDDTLDLGQIDSGRMKLNPEPTDLVQVLTRSAATFEASATAAGTRIAVTGAESGQRRVRLSLDPQRLQQIVDNLVKNAVANTPDGTVTLSARVAVGNDDAAGRVEAVIEVRDTGSGIPADQLKRLFQVYERTDLSVLRRDGGSGLGLAIVRSLVTLMQGRIDIESAVGEGTCVRVRLPAPLVPSLSLIASEGQVVKPASEAAANPFTAVSEIIAARPGRGLTVLVVEDVAVNRRLFESMLRKLDAEVVSAADGHEAVERWRQHAPDAILMDIHMPVMNGLEAIAEIRRQEVTGHTPIFVLSASVMGDDREAATEAGADGYLAKPVDLAALSQALTRLRGLRNGGSGGASKAGPV